MLVDTTELDMHLESPETRCVVITSNDRQIAPPHVLIPMPSDPSGYAVELYDALRRADAERADAELAGEGSAFGTAGGEMPELEEEEEVIEDDDDDDDETFMRQMMARKQARKGRR